MAFKLGDEVWLTRHYMRGEPSMLVKVTKVGRKYVYVNGGRTPYHPETGSEVTEYAHHSSIQTKEERERWVRRSEAEKALRDFGIRIDPWGKARASECLVEVYEALRPLMNRTPQARKETP